MDWAKGTVLNSRHHTIVLTTLTLLSGCCALAYEILYVRALTTLLGDMFYVHAALLSTFLVGIGLGAKMARRSFRWLAVFEILTGIYAMAWPVISMWLSQQQILVELTSSPLLTILATVGFLVTPSLLIGFCIPLFSAYIKVHRQAKLSFQWVYMVYNLGAFLSIFAVEFVLIRQLGIIHSLMCIGAINILNGIVLVLIKAAPSSLRAESRTHFPGRLIVSLAMASLCSAVFQMFFLKLSYLVFHPHRETFALALAMTLLGMFLGALVASMVKIRYETCLVLAVALLGIIYVNYLPLVNYFGKTRPDPGSHEFIVFAHKFGFGCLFALGPMILFGALIPSLMRSENEVAGESGYLICVSSLANSAGYLLYVLIGHPWLTTGILLAVLGGMLLLASMLAVKGYWSKMQATFAVAGIILMVLLIWIWEDRYFYLAQWVHEIKPGDQVTVFKSGAESATLLHANQSDWISYNGHPSVYVQKDGVINYAEMVSGIIPALSAPRLDRAMVLGLGTGVTASATSQLFSATDVVEINHAFFKMMPVLSWATMNIGENPAVRLHLADGRAFLVGKEGVYDAILNSIPAPTYFSASKIYTIEFYERVVRALKPDGVFCTWLAAHEMSEAGVTVVLSALKKSFAYCDLRLMRGDYYMATCSNEPIRTRQFSQLLANDRLIEELQKGIPNFDIDEFFEDTRISKNIFEKFTPMVNKENTDDHPILEFLIVRVYKMRKLGRDLFRARQALFNIDPVRLDQVSDPTRLVRRAGVFAVSNPGYFKQNFEPLFEENPDLNAMYLSWKARELER